MARQLTVRNVFDKKHKLFEFDGMWQEVFGAPERSGEWIIYGEEKHGKTWFALALARYISSLGVRTTYVSGEEGLSVDFKRAMQRAGYGVHDRVKFLDYTELEMLEQIISRRYAPQVLFIDNTTAYEDELTKAAVREIHRKYNDKLLIVFLSHEERKRPYPANAALISRLARIKIRVEGLTAFVGGRCPGGIITIDEEKSQLYHGTKKA